MCHWVREPDRRRDIAAEELPAKPGLIRPRFVGAVAVALVALTAAALPLATSTPAVPDEHKLAVTTAAVQLSEPAGPVIEQTALAADDGVPSTQRPPDSVRAGSHCDHGL